MNTGGKIFILGALGAAAYFTWTCPCEQLMSCHMTEFYIALGLAASIPFIWNYFSKG